MARNGKGQDWEPLMFGGSTRGEQDRERPLSLGQERVKAPREESKHRIADRSLGERL